MLGLVASAVVTALATGLGAIPVYAFGAERARLLWPAMWGVVIGVMTVASVQGLLIPGFRDGSALSVLGGLAAGVAFLLVARHYVDEHQAGLGRGVRGRQALLVFLVLFVHSLPEGLALGAAWASKTAGLGVFVFLAIAIQNVPEGTAAAIPLRSEGSTSAVKAFWIATLTSAPQPVGAVIAYALVEAAHSLLGVSFGFAAGAMLALVAVELIPEAARSARPRTALAVTLVSAALMAALGAILDVG